MLVHIDLSSLDPPRGTVTFDDEEALDFTGWLGLLGALSKRMGPVPARRGDGGPGGGPSGEMEVAAGDGQDQLGP